MNLKQIVRVSLVVAVLGFPVTVSGKPPWKACRMIIVGTMRDDDGDIQSARVVINFFPPDRFEMLNADGEPTLRVIGDAYYMRSFDSWLRVRKETYEEAGNNFFLSLARNQIATNKDALHRGELRLKGTVRLGNRRRRLFEVKKNLEDPDDPSTLIGKIWVSLETDLPIRMQFSVYDEGSKRPSAVLTCYFQYDNRIRIEIPKT